MHISPPGPTGGIGTGHGHRFCLPDDPGFGSRAMQWTGAFSSQTDSQEPAGRRVSKTCGEDSTKPST